MPSDSCDRRRTTTAKPHNIGGCATGAPPPEPEHLPCPRCDSTNTKFCYYNNYNFSQPRHFCKACRRYWTHGGTLRDIPVGGGSRKNAKRSRLTNTTTTHINTALEFRYMAQPTATPILIPFAGEHGGRLHLLADGKSGVSVSDSFTSLLNSTQGPAGFFGLGIGGFEDGEFGFGRSIWPFSGIGDGGVGGHYTASGDGGHYTASGDGGGNTWQLDSGEGGGGGGGGECFTLPDLAISTPGMI